MIFAPQVSQSSLLLTTCAERPSFTDRGLIFDWQPQSTSALPEVDSFLPRSFDARAEDCD